MLKPISTIAGLCGVVVLVVLVAVPIASAHYPVVVASLACDGTVSFTVTADLQDGTRNNTQVAVFDTSGGSQPVATGVFDTANNWSFSGTYVIPTTVTSDTLTPQALGVWGDGVQPSNGPSTTITAPQGCASTETPPVVQPTPAAPPPPAVPAVPTVSPGNPAIAISKSPKAQTIASGSTATFTIVVTNTGDVVLSNVFVADALSPLCAATSSTIAGMAAMASGASITYTCTAVGVIASFTNVATDTGTPPSGPDVTATDTAVVSVTGPFTPPIPAPTPAATGKHPAVTPISGGTSIAITHVAPFTPPKLVSHAAPTTAG